jgi:hypothetical protein
VRFASFRLTLSALSLLSLLIAGLLWMVTANGPRSYARWALTLSLILHAAFIWSGLLVHRETRARVFVWVIGLLLAGAGTLLFAWVGVVPIGTGLSSLLVVVLASWFAWFAYRTKDERTRRALALTGCCPACGYDLRGIPSGGVPGSDSGGGSRTPSKTCPECGVRPRTRAVV